MIVESQMQDGEAIKATLQELGYIFEEHKESQSLYGYMGDKRKQKAHIIIRRQQVGPGANDIGFLRKSNGRYEVIISEFDKSQKQGQDLLKKMKQIYGKNHVMIAAKKLGMTFRSQKTTADNKIKIRCTYSR